MEIECFERMIELCQYWNFKRDELITSDKIGEKMKLNKRQMKKWWPLIESYVEDANVKFEEE